jgi:hypothetical protein
MARFASTARRPGAEPQPIVGHRGAGFAVLQGPSRKKRCELVTPTTARVAASQTTTVARAFGAWAKLSRDGPCQRSWARAYERRMRERENDFRRAIQSLAAEIRYCEFSLQACPASASARRSKCSRRPSRSCRYSCSPVTLRRHENVNRDIFRMDVEPYAQPVKRFLDQKQF